MFMFPAVSNTELMQMSWRNSVMMAEAQAVIAMRVFGMFGLWPVNSGENNRMVSEKIAAVQEGQAAAMRAMMRGGDAAKVSEAAMRPVRRRTKANVKRLVGLTHQKG